MNTEVQSSYAEHDRQVRISYSKLGAILAIILMPAGLWLDYHVYPKHLGDFLLLRILCSFLVGVVLGLFYTPFGKRHYRFLGMTWYMLPALCISWMIYVAGDEVSPYYAGLNIVMIGAGLFLPWTYLENLTAGTLVMLTYIATSFLRGTAFENRFFWNNLYFLVLTIVIVVVTSYFHSKRRFREFCLNFELAESRRKLEEGNRKLVELDQVKSRFFANMSHELRTPLTLLISPLEAILKNKAHLLDVEIRGLLQTMHSNAMRLLKLINDLLDLERLESNKMQIKREPVAIHEFVRGLGNSVQAMAQEKRLKLETKVAEDIGTVLVDRDKLEKVILNLLFNALKFTPAGGLVTLEAERRNPDGRVTSDGQVTRVPDSPNETTSQLIIRVKDTGIGISENHLPFIFDRFWQADGSSNRRYQGTGIGLALVKELVETHGGTVTAESEAGKGTTMTVFLPYVKAGDSVAADVRRQAEISPPSPSPHVGSHGSGNGNPQADNAEEWLTNLYRRAEFYTSMTPLRETLRREETSIRNNKPRVLIVDDEPDMLGFLKSQLSDSFAILEAVDGQQAIEKTSQFLPEIVLLDMMMPEKDGLQVCRELRAKPLTRNIPIILLTARADDETKLAALSAGANDFLSKPFSTTELHLRVKNLIASHELERKLARQNQILEATVEQLKDTQAQLVHSEKMAGLGRMSAGIIHEINNPLNYSKTALYTLKSKGKLLPTDQQIDFEEILRDIEDGVNRVTHIVSDLRTFTHPDTDQIDTVNVDEILSVALRFLSNQLKDTIPVEKKIADGLTVPGNPNKLTQVLINLLQNSIDAIQNKKFSNEQPTIWIEGRNETGKSILLVRDNGEGIPPENLNRIFDPFFTTKDVGQGMGLGLSICYRIISEGGGKIFVKSQSGKFTEFTLEFPREYRNILAER